MTTRPLRLLFLGLDGADPRLLDDLLASRRLPHLARLAENGALVPLRSTVPAATYPAWATCLTGVNPGRHGVLDFATTSGYRVSFGAPRPAVPTWPEALAAAGLDVGAIGFPGRLHADGALRFHVAGWETPLDEAATRRHVRPPELWGRIRRALGPEALRFAALDEFAAREAGREHPFLEPLRDSVRTRVELALFLCGELPVDVLALHLQALDTVGHHAWPRADESAGAAIPAAIAATYEAVDEAVGELTRRLEPAFVVAASDHGIGPTSDLVVSLNALLVHGGFQHPAPRSPLGVAATLARRTAVRTLPAPLRRLAFRFAGTALAGATESLSRFSGIDLSRSEAFSDELTYAPSVRLNVRGREPSGPIEPTQRRRKAEELAAYLKGIRRPDGAPLFSAALLREEVSDGPFTEQAPDVHLVLAEDAKGRTPLLCPPQLRPTLGDAWHTTIPAAERPGGKGGLLRGSHRPLGILLATPLGPGTRPPADPDLRDVAPLVFRLLGAPEPPGLEKPLAARPSLPPPPSPPPPRADDALTDDERRALADRLRALGYVEDDGDWS